MKLFILACCLLVLASSSPVPLDDHEPVNGPAKTLSSKISPASSHGSSPTLHKDSESAEAHIAFSSPKGHDIAQDTSSKSGSGSGSGSDSAHSSRSKRSEESNDSASSKEW